MPRHHRPRPSQWAQDPVAEYSFACYMKIGRCHWLGTSMGGAIAIKAAAGPCRGASSPWCSTTSGRRPIRPALERIKSYAGTPPAYATLGELEQFFRLVCKPYGFLSD